MAGVGYTEIFIMLLVTLVFLSPSNMMRFLSDVWRVWLFLRNFLRTLTSNAEAFFHNVRVMDLDQKREEGEE